jgi:N-acetylmuramoyl-L-alanine amidase
VSADISEASCIVLIDPGHGGIDPGMVGNNNELEKDINLQIALKLKTILEAQNYFVIMTREEDVGLYSEDATNKKREDLAKRVAIADAIQPDVFLSIHQNSYSDEGCRGAQVFYYNASEESKRLAEYIQKAFILYVDQDNYREIKANETYYLLKESSYPTVIIECGFLSNYEEASLLLTEEYQEKIALAIYKGTSDFIELNATQEK